MQGEAPAAAAAVSVARGRMHLVSASVWRRHGCASLAAAEAASFLSCHTLDPDDTLHAYATLALIANDLQGAAPVSPSIWPGSYAPRAAAGEHQSHNIHAWSPCGLSSACPCFRRPFHASFHVLKNSLPAVCTSRGCLKADTPHCILREAPRRHACGHVLRANLLRDVLMLDARAAPSMGAPVDESARA